MALAVSVMNMFLQGRVARSTQNYFCLESYPSPANHDERSYSAIPLNKELVGRRDGFVSFLKDICAKMSTSLDGTHHADFSFTNKCKTTHT